MLPDRTLLLKSVEPATRRLAEPPQGTHQQLTGHRKAPAARTTTESPQTQTAGVGAGPRRPEATQVKVLSIYQIGRISNHHAEALRFKPGVSIKMEIETLAKRGVIRPCCH